MTQRRPSGPRISPSRGIGGGQVGARAEQIRYVQPSRSGSVAPLVEEEAVDARTGSGTLDATASLTGSGTKQGLGSGTVSGVAGFTSTGRRAGSGTGIIAASAGFASSGTRATGGTGTLTLLTTITSTATPARAGSGTVTAAATLAGTGDKAEGDARSGTGTLAAVADLTGTGTKASDGEGSLVALVALNGTGVSSAAARPTYGGSFRTYREARDDRRGSGAPIQLHAHLYGTGVKSFEVDDELVLALAA